MHEKIYDQMVDEVEKVVSGIKVGDPFSETSQMGPVNSAAQFDKVMSMIGSGLDEGARLVHGGKRPDGAEFETGYWVEPTVFADVTPDMRIATEEIFGPVLSIMKWSDEAEMIAIANAVDLGLTAAVWTNDIGKAMTTARELENGYVWINGVAAQVPGMPYGGYKNSGVGRERTLEEMISYTEEKSIHIML